MKRFYKTVAVSEAQGGYGVTLDGKPVRTPGKQVLTVPFRPLAEAMADEWSGQGETVEPAALAMTRLANSAIDVVAGRRDAIVEETARYAGTDLVCYRADGPDDLVLRQHHAWQPLLDWVRERYGASLRVTRSVMPVPQSREALEALRRAVAAYDAFPLTGLHAATAAAGSAVIGLALAEGRIGPDRAFEISQLDETYQIEHWGEDPEAARRRSALKADLAAAARFMELCA